MTPDTTKLTRKQVAAEQLADWEWLRRRDRGEVRDRRVRDRPQARQPHRRRGRGGRPPPRPRPSPGPLVHVRLVSHDAGGVTSRDVAMARRISEIAADAGRDADAGEADQARVRPRHVRPTPAAQRFWSAVLGLRRRSKYDADGRPRRPPGGALVPGDRSRHGEVHGSASTSTSRSRPTWRSPDRRGPGRRRHAGQRPSGRPAWTVLADPEGNKAASAPGRDGRRTDGSARQLHHPGRARPRRHARLLRRRPRVEAGPRGRGRRADDPGRRQAGALAVGGGGFEAEVGPIRRGEGSRRSRWPTTSPTREEVDAVLDDRPRGRAPTRRTTPWSASGAATPATSPTPTATAGRSPTTPDPIGQEVLP